MQVEELFSETPDNEKLSPTVDAYDELGLYAVSSGN